MKNRIPPLAPSYAIHTATSTQAFATVRKNKLRRYPSPGKDGERLFPLVSPAPRPSFTFALSDSVFAVGSCFARNLEGALDSAGMSVLSRQPDLGPIGDAIGFAGNFLNKYTAPSILNDLKWALERESFPGEEVIYPIGNNAYCDPQLGLVNLPYPLNDIMQMRTRYLDTMAAAADADVVIITLGYVEAWYDNQLGIYLNVAPPPKICRRQPDRFEFRVLGFEDILGTLGEIYDLLKKHRSKPLRMLITVSPVPLLSTFRDMDVLVANTYSKAVQRAAVETFVADKKDVDYFPSYEMVALSNPTICWARGDYRHVSPDIVARIMSNVLFSYIPDLPADGTYDGSPMTRSAIFATARLLIKCGAPRELAILFSQNRTLMRQDEMLLAQVADVLQTAQLVDVAEDALVDLIECAPQRPVPLQRLIALSSRNPAMRSRTEALLALHQERFPGRASFRAQIMRAFQ